MFRHLETDIGLNHQQPAIKSSSWIPYANTVRKKINNNAISLDE